MKVTLPQGIASISGTISSSRHHKLIAKTFKKADGTKETRFYMMPRFQRSTPPSDKEIAARNRFWYMAKEVSRRIKDGDHRPRKIIWEEVKAQMPNL